MSDHGAQADQRPSESTRVSTGFDWLLEPPSQPLAPVVAPLQTRSPTPGDGRLDFATLAAHPAPAIVPPSALSSEHGASRGLRLERRNATRRPSSSPLDWTSFVLSFLAPPLGLIAGVVSLLLCARRSGYTSSIAKAAVAIGSSLSLVLAVGVVIELHVRSQQAAHDAIIASSAAYCAELARSPGILHSSTFGWPAPAGTIPESITAMQTYESEWTRLAKIAPSGIRAGTLSVASAAGSIIKSIESTQVLDDAANVTQLQQAAAGSGVTEWVSEYCK